LGTIAIQPLLTLMGNQLWTFPLGSTTNVNFQQLKLLLKMLGYNDGKSLFQYIHVNTNSNRLVVLIGKNDGLSRAVNKLLANRIYILIGSDIVFWLRVNQLGLSKQMI
jgi:hypothetical protein